MMARKDTSAAANGPSQRNGHPTAAATSPAAATAAVVAPQAPLQDFLFPLRLLHLVYGEVVFDLQNLTSHPRRHVHLYSR